MPGNLSLGATECLLQSHDCQVTLLHLRSSILPQFRVACLQSKHKPGLKVIQHCCM